MADFHAQQHQVLLCSLPWLCEQLQLYGMAWGDEEGSASSSNSALLIPLPMPCPAHFVPECILCSSPWPPIRACYTTPSPSMLASSGGPSEATKHAQSTAGRQHRCRAMLHPGQRMATPPWHPMAPCSHPVHEERCSRARVREVCMRGASRAHQGRIRGASGVHRGCMKGA